MQPGEKALVPFVSVENMMRIVHDAGVAETTASQWERYAFDLRGAHLREIKLILDVEEPEYRH